MFHRSSSYGRSGRKLVRMASLAGLGCLISPLATSIASAQASSTTAETGQVPSNWRDIKDGVGGYPAGPMLEIAVRRVHADKIEMFKWRSESIAMLSAQPGPLIEREWHSVLSMPKNAGAGTWTGMTWWENQQKWQDMANILFPTPVFANWLKTLDMTLVFAKPLDDNFDLRTLAQSGAQVLELGVLSLPKSSANATTSDESTPIHNYLEVLKKNGAKTYRFSIYKNPIGLVGPYTVAYNKSGPPSATGEDWFVYMATYDTPEERVRLQSTGEVRLAFDALTKSMVKDHSDIQVMTRTTSKVCIKAKTNAVSYDPDECHVGEMGSGDTWASSYGDRPQPCVGDFGVVSQLPPRTCAAVGGNRPNEPAMSARP